MTTGGNRGSLNILASAETASIWRAVACELGYISPSGRYVGQGSISGLMGALAGGAVDPIEFAKAIHSVTLAQAEMPEVTP